MLSDTLHVLLGAALVAIGVLTTAVADRIRGLKTRAPRAASTTAFPVVDAAELAAAPARARRAARGATRRSEAHGGDGEDVIAALIAAGYKKAVATEATWNCDNVERATVETWTRAALRRAGGVAS